MTATKGVAGITMEGKKGVILGVANEFSIAWAVAEELHAQGATMGFSHLPDRNEFKRMEKRVRRCTDTIGPALVEPCDVTSDDEMATFFAKVKERIGTIDFMVHSIAFAPLDDIRCATLDVTRAGFLSAMEISVYSFIKASQHAARLMGPDGGSIVTMTYFGGEKVVGGYNLMGLCKAALDSAVRYLAYDLGTKNIRVNGVSAGPLKTLAASAIGEFDDMLRLYEAVSPLGRSVTRQDIAKTAAFLLSPASAMISGEILHVDGGYNIMGSPGHAFARLTGKEVRGVIGG